MGRSGVLSSTLAALLKLPAKDRIELAMALWDSLIEEEREAELVLTPEQEVELDRRGAEHLANPDSAIPWQEVRRKLATDYSGSLGLCAREGETRRAVIRRFPYAVDLRSIDEEIIVLPVMHGRRNPRHWRSRRCV